MLAMDDPVEVIDVYARLISDAERRVSAIYEVVRSAAGVDEEVRELWTDIGRERLSGAETIAGLLRKKGGLRRGLSIERARDVIWVYNDPGLYHALVTARGWRHNYFRNWLADTLKQQLLE